MRHSALPPFGKAHKLRDPVHTAPPGLRLRQRRSFLWLGGSRQSATLRPGVPSHTPSRLHESSLCLPPDTLLPQQPEILGCVSSSAVLIPLPVLGLTPAMPLSVPEPGGGVLPAHGIAPLESSLRPAGAALLLCTSTNNTTAAGLALPARMGSRKSHTASHIIQVDNVRHLFAQQLQQIVRALPRLAHRELQPPPRHRVHPEPV